ncbi:MAG: DUF484 family protein [Chromatiales bacterium]|jgi:uncharacterized protein YigA (DUF484 family)
MSQDSDFESQVVDYLKDHPDFFSVHDELLAELQLPHDSGGAVSLIERQVTTLRKRATDCQQQLYDLLDIARENDSLNNRLHQMTLELFDAATLDDVIDTLQNHLRDQFNADAVEVKLFSSSELNKEVVKGSPSPALFSQLMKDGRPKCGRIDQSKLEYLFGDMSREASSVALVPLDGINISGILAIGNSNPEHFSCSQSTDFLRRLGDIVSKAFESVELPA